jgi:Tfp pilus assembly protein PilO
MANTFKDKIKDQFDLKQIYLWDIKIVLVCLILITLVLSYVIYLSVTDEYVLDLNNLRNEETSLKQQIQEQYGVVNVLPEYMRRVESLNRIESIVNLQFPDDDEIPQMLVQIHQQGELAGVLINTLLPEAEDNVYNESGINLPKDSQIWTRRFTINGSADVQNMIQFIFRLAEFPRVIQVNSIALDRVDNSTINFVMTISIFFVK